MLSLSEHVCAVNISQRLVLISLCIALSYDFKLIIQQMNNCFEAIQYRFKPAGLFLGSTS